MGNKLVGNAIVFTQGGPTAVINASWVGVVEGLRDAPADVLIGIWGSLHGIDGVLNEEFVDLRAQSQKTLDAVSRTPATALGTTRHKPNAEDNQKMLAVFKKYNIRYVFGAGGNDTSESLDLINDAAKASGYDLRMFHVCKTVDCDLMENDHTCGYGSAARFVANAFRGADLDNKAFGGIYLGVCMGRHAGFLTAAAALRRNEIADSGPHLVYVPERAFSVEQFVKDVEAVYKQHGRAVIAVSEGIEDKAHTPILQLLSSDKLEADSHGNVQLSGTGALADALVEQLKKHLEGNGIVKKLRARGDTFGYLQRSFTDLSSADREEALQVGWTAAQEALRGEFTDGSIAIQRASSNPYRAKFVRVPLKAVAGKTRHLPDEFINAAGNNVTEQFIAWGLPLIGENPLIGELDLSKKVAKK
ncbi:pyrophosphate--fructose 6-phosphate 1-phosphotransferase [Planctomycetales bacterium]|nr:pyrophosphate--fructose 6-phosphate 1-phosphotransferase [Planctomycetales bacterium]GHT06310.1 pyrophosphate--fructose 6-phosphate 1-phosphotransferase [Planctomycetales bacterium]